jgi:hypothetical protein
VTARRRIAQLAAAALAAYFVASDPPTDLPRRIAFLRHYASQSLPVRRLGGSSADFDRPYFILLEWARRKLPPSARGLAVFPDREIPGRGVYLTLYEFAPLPAAVAPARIPPGWLALVYGPRRPPGWRVVADLPGGALLDPAP